MSNTYQKKSRRAQPDPVPAEAAVPEQVIVSMAEIAAAAKEGLLALAVGTGLQVMAAMFEEDVARLCGPDGKHNRERAGYRHGTEAGSVTLGGRRLAVTRPRVRAADGSGELHLPSYRLFSSTASGCFVPSMPMPSATTQVCSPKCTPSTMNATKSRSSSRLLISSANAVSVAATNRPDTADLLTDAAASPTACPAGSRPRT